MASPEHAYTPLQLPEFQHALSVILQKIERAEVIENPIERTRMLDELFEQQDWLQTEIDGYSPHQHRHG